MPHQAEGEFAQLKEQLEAALDLSGQPVKRGTMAHKHIVYMMLLDAASQARDVETILKHGPMLERLAVRDHHQPYLAICYRAYGVAHFLTEEFDKSEEKLNQALEIFETLGMTWQTGRTLTELGFLAQAKNERSKAFEFFTRAGQLLEVIQARPDIERINAALKNYKVS